MASTNFISVIDTLSRLHLFKSLQDITQSKMFCSQNVQLTNAEFIHPTKFIYSQAREGTSQTKRDLKLKDRKIKIFFQNCRKWPFALSNFKSTQSPTFQGKNQKSNSYILNANYLVILIFFSFHTDLVQIWDTIFLDWGNNTNGKI